MATGGPWGTATARPRGTRTGMTTGMTTGMIMGTTMTTTMTMTMIMIMGTATATPRIATADRCPGPPP